MRGFVVQIKTSTTHTQHITFGRIPQSSLNNDTNQTANEIPIARNRTHHSICPNYILSRAGLCTCAIPHQGLRTHQLYTCIRGANYPRNAHTFSCPIINKTLQRHPSYSSRGAPYTYSVSAVESDARRKWFGSDTFKWLARAYATTAQVSRFVRQKVNESVHSFKPPWPSPRVHSHLTHLTPYTIFQRLAQNQSHAFRTNRDSTRARTRHHIDYKSTPNNWLFVGYPPRARILSSQSRRGW